ncbi:MAG: 1-acyl-sn-glycerol-3-phosphate acyltransferase [Anaeromyxobacteraceae bacterium]
MNAVTETTRFPKPPRAQWLILTPLRPFLRLWFRPRVRGLELVPKDRPVIFVAKHPRSFLYLETMLLGLIVYWVKRDRPLIRPMEQRNTSIHRAPILGWIRRNVNSVEATEEAGLATLAAGESVLIYPGGGRDLYGPPDRLDWNGRRGFARIAAKARALVVPVVMVGADGQHPWRIPLGGRRSLWFPPFPLPVRLDYAFGTPMEPPSADDAEAVAEFAERVAETTQALIDRTLAEREGGR